MLTLANGGRSLVVLAAGYRQAEFDYYDVVLNQRAAIIEETVEVLQRTWAGESFAYQGRRIELVSPVPEPAPRIVLGGASPLMARMAAPLNLGFAPGSDEIYQFYRAECLAREHTDPGPRPIDGPHFLFLSEDPDKAWSEIGGHILENAQMYAGFLSGTHTGANVNVPEVTLESLQQSASHAIVTPDQCITLLKEKEKGGDVWVANLNPNRQREIGKIRPVLVFQANELTAANSPTIVILPMSTRVNRISSTGASRCRPTIDY